MAHNKRAKLLTDTSVEEVIKCINVLSLLSLMVILGRPPRLPSRDIHTFPPPPLAGERRQANTLTIHPSPPLSGSQPGVVYFMYTWNNNRD